MNDDNKHTDNLHASFMDRRRFPGQTGMAGALLAGSALDWPDYSIDHRQTMVFNNEPRVVSDPDPEVRRLWSAV
ncbi:MAG: hypothetical protein WEB57_00145 [Pseudohongiellaceae bacterium]